MKIHREFQQHSVEWLTARAGKVTASEIDNLVTPKWAVRGMNTGTVQSYLAAKVAEWWIGTSINDVNSFAMEQGTLIEDEVLGWLQVELDAPVEQVGFIETDDGAAGCSPDGLMENIGVEIKSPQPAKHCANLLDGGVPEDYIVQVQASMWVTGFQQWRFLSYSRRFPKLLLTVDRDEKAQEAITDALALFLAKLQSAKDRLCELNGGLPKRYSTPPPKPTFQQNENDIPTP